MITLKRVPVTVEFADRDNQCTVRLADGRRRVVGAHQLSGPTGEIARAVREGRSALAALEREEGRDAVKNAPQSLQDGTGRVGTPSNGSDVGKTAQEAPGGLGDQMGHVDPSKRVLAPIPAHQTPSGGCL